MTGKKLNSKQRVARYLSRHDGLATGEIARSLNLSVSTVATALSSMKKQGMVESIGTPGSCRYFRVKEPGSSSRPFGVSPNMALFNQLLASVRHECR
jgi:predicted ArsR family transcriptional regulator